MGISALEGRPPNMGHSGLEPALRQYLFLLKEINKHEKHKKIKQWKRKRNELEEKICSSKCNIVSSFIFLDELPFLWIE